jgi:hypothetical protein
MLLVLGRRQGREGAAVERALEADDAVALGMAVGGLVLPHHLDDAFHRLGAGIGEKHLVGEGHRAQPVGQPLALGNPVEIGDVDDALGLLGDRLDHVGMRMAERIDRTPEAKSR